MQGSNNPDPHQHQHVDPFTDPNLLMAIGIVDKIKTANQDNINILNSRQESHQEAMLKEEQRKIEEAVKKAAQEALSKERTPVEKIIDKIQDKRILTREDVTSLTLSLCKEFSDGKNKPHELVAQYLQFLYYVLLNIQPFSHGRNYLENQALQKLLKETFAVIKQWLEAITSKKQEAVSLAPLINSVLAPSLKLFALFMLPSTSTQLSHYDMMHYKYLRVSHVKTLSNAQLQLSLNPLLKEFNSSTKLAPKVTELPQSQEIPKQQALIADTDDFITSSLEFVHADYSVLAHSLSTIINQKHKDVALDETMSIPEEEEKEEGKIENIDAVAKEIINKLKLTDLFGKVIDRLVSEEELYLQVESSLFATIKKYLDKIPQIKSKNFTHFITKNIQDRALKAQQAIIEHFNKMNDLKAVQEDQSMHDEGDISELKANTQTLAKSLEIVGEDDGQFIIEILKASGNLKYLSKLIKVDSNRDTMTGMIESIAYSFCYHLQFLISDAYLQKLDPIQILDLLTTLTRFVAIARNLNNFRQEGRIGLTMTVSAQVNTKNSKQIVNLKSDVKSVRTRSQLKKQKEFSPTQELSIVEEKKPDLLLQMVLINVDVSELLKKAIGLLVQVLPFFVKNNSYVIINHSLLQNLFKIALKNTHAIKSLVSGLLSEFTKPSLAYNKDSIAQISSYLLKNIDQILDSTPQTVLALKLLFQISNSKAQIYDNQIAFYVATHLFATVKSWNFLKADSQSTIKSFNSTFALLACIFSITQNQEVQEKQRQQLAEQVFTCEQNLNIRLQLLQITLLNKDSLNKIKLSVMKYITQVMSDQDSLKDSLLWELDKTVYQLINNGTSDTFDKSLQAHLKDKLTIEYFVDLLKTLNFGENSQAVKQPEQKNIMISSLKKLCQISSDQGIAQISPSADLQTFINSHPHTKLPEILYAQYDQHSKLLSQNIVTKIQSKNPISEDENYFIQSQITSLKLLALEFYKNSKQAIQKQLLTHDPNCPNAEEQAQIIYECTKNVLNNFGMSRALNLSLNLPSQNSTLEQQFLEKIVDSQLMSKHLYQLKGSNGQIKLEEVIYAYCLSTTSDKLTPEIQDIQIKTSQALLMRAVYQNLCKITFAINDSSSVELKHIASDIAQQLLALRNDVPFLEQSDSSGASFDNETSDKLYMKTLNCPPNEAVPHKEYLKLKNFDYVLNLLVKSREVSAKFPNINQLIQEVATSTQMFNQFVKSASDMKVLTNFLQVDDNECSKFLRSKLIYPNFSLNMDVPTLLWQLALQYLEFSAEQIEDRTKIERKGGIQMVIDIDKKTEKISNRQRRKNVRFSKETKEDEKVQEKPATQDTQKVLKVINPIANKILNFLFEIMDINTGSTNEQKRLAGIIGASFGSLGSQTIHFVEKLNETRQFILLKNMVVALSRQVQENKHQIQANLSNSIVSFLHSVKQYPSDQRMTALLLSLELANYVTSNNEELAGFISSQLLAHSEEFFHNNEQSLTKLQILDFMCQLAVVKYQQDNKFTENQVISLRKQKQDAIKSQAEQQKLDILKSTSEQQDDQTDLALGLSKLKSQISLEVEGFKQEKIIHNDQDSLRYMEWPQENCTFSVTQKKFKDQHWYQCFTCNLKDNSGCCSVCVRKCHKGHAVVYSKISNFFCDCGDSGRCQSLKPQQPGQPIQQINDRGPRDHNHLFQQIIGQRNPHENPYQGPPHHHHDPHNNGLFQSFYSGQGQFRGEPPKYDDFIMDEFRNAELHNPPMFLNPPSHQFIPSEQLHQYKDQSGSSEDEHDPNNDVGGLRSIHKMMKMIKQVPDRFGQPPNYRAGNRAANPYQSGMNSYMQQPVNSMYGAPPFGAHPKDFPQLAPREVQESFNQQRFEEYVSKNREPIANNDHQSIQSNIESINPLEDPFSDAGMDNTIDNNQIQLGFSQSGASNIPPSDSDIVMAQEIEANQLIPNVVDLIKSQRSHFDEVYNYLCSILSPDGLNKQISSQDQQMSEESKKPESKLPMQAQKVKEFLLQSKDKITLVQDQAQFKKTINVGQFLIKNLNDNSLKPALQNSVNLLSITDSNKQGLVAICEDHEVCFYAGSQFFEEQSVNKDLEQFSFQYKDENTMIKIDSQKLSFPPLQVIFNEVQPQYLAIAGPQNAEILVFQKNGKISYKVCIDMMLETFGRDLTIVNMRWLPGSHTSIAIATRDFIKIFDLGEDLMSPTHNIMIFNGFITDFAFSQPMKNGNIAETTVYASSKSGQIFYMPINYKLSSFETKQEGEKMNVDQDNSDLMMTEALQIDNQQFKIKENTAAVSVYCTSQDILFISFADGQTLIGQKESSSASFEGFKFIVSEDASFNQSNLKNAWQKFGEVICGFKEILPLNQVRKSSDAKLIVLAFSRKLNNSQISTQGIPLMLEIKENKVLVNVVKNSATGQNSMLPVIGQAYVKKSQRGSNQMRLLNIFFDSSAATYICKGIFQDKDQEEEKQVEVDPVEKIENDIKMAHGNVDRLISKGDLPTEAHLTPSFFEKMKSIINDPILSQKITFGGDLLTSFRTTKATLDVLSRQLTQNQVLIQEGSKKSYRFSVASESSSDFVITGMRVRMDYSAYRQQTQFVTMKLFNREVKFTNYIARGHGQPMLFDIPFCDAEIIFGSSSSSQNLTFEFQTEDPKQVPIRIVSIDIFQQSKKDFNYKEKMRKLEKLNADRLKKSLTSLMIVPSGNALIDQNIKSELLNTKNVPIASWKEKINYLKGQIDISDLEAVIAIDVFTQYLSIVDASTLNIDLEQVLNKLKAQLLPENSLNNFELAAVKRCIKKILSIMSPNAQLGSPYNYETIKDQILVTFINSRIQQQDFTLTQLRKALRGLMKINKKRFYQVFKIIEHNPNLPYNLIETYVRLKKVDSSNQSKQLQQDINDLLNLVITTYQQLINSTLTPQSLSLEETINKVYSDNQYTQVFNLLKPLLDNENEQIQKLTISNLLTLSNQYSKTLQKSLTYNKVPSVHYDGKHIKILVVDFSPHLIKYALNLIEGINAFDLGYQLAFKIIKTFEMQCKNSYNGKFIDYIINPVARFITNTTFMSVNPSQLQLTGDTASSQTDRQLYVNLVLTNLLMHQPMKDENFKIKPLKLGLDVTIQKKIVDAITHDQETLFRLIEWIQATVKAYTEEFYQQKGSFRTKLVDGIPQGVYQVITKQGKDSGGSGRQLLRPVVETTAWKWHPLFLRSDSQFDLLDRKIPTQLLLMVNFLLSQSDQIEKNEQISNKTNDLIETISQLAFRKPADSFLKHLGSLAVRSLVVALMRSQPEKLKELENQVEKKIRGLQTFHDFNLSFTKTYEQAFNKKGQPQLTFHLQFLLHSVLQKGWNKASNNVDTWRSFVIDHSKGLVSSLVNCAFHLNEETAKLCLQIAALSYDETCVLSFKSVENVQISLFSIFQRSHLKQIEDKSTPPTLMAGYSNLEIRKLIEIMLLGRNNKAVRIATAHLIKGVFDMFPKERQVIKNVMIEKLPLLRTKGANSMEFIALLSYIINREIETEGFQSDESLYQKLCREIYKQVINSNQQLTAHENLNIYASLSKLVPVFSQSGSQDIMINFDEKSLKEILHEARPSFLEAASKGNGKIGNPYMLESEACSKCFSQKAAPFQQQRALDLKTEVKFTDNRHIYRLNQAYLIKQVVVNQDQFKGNMYAKVITLYINNSQGVDLADMKNNMNFWKKVKSQDAEFGQRQVIIDLTLPVTAQNILIEFTTGISSKIADRHGDRQKAQPDAKDKKAKKKKSLQIQSMDQVAGIDSVIMSLPKQVAGTIGLIAGSSGEEGAGAGDYDKLICHRCHKPIQSKNGVCNSCGENAQQCQQCRNINYDKQDAYVCTECGFSRWLRMDIQLLVQQGFACEKIENEDQKAQALQQIEINLQQAQSAYQQLMKNRQTIAALIKRANEGDSSKGFVQVYSDECADSYLKMMKSLNNIKALKYEIDQFTSAGTSLQEEQKLTLNREDGDLKPLGLNRSYSAISSPEESQVQETCFSCIQEYLKGLLCFIQITAEKLASPYKKQGFLELLYKSNLKMYTTQLQDPARRALCSLLKKDKEQSQALIAQIADDIFSKQNVIPPHLLAQNITQETQLVLDMLKVQSILKAKEDGDNFYDSLVSQMWAILFKALVEGKKNAAIADQVAGSLIQYVRELCKASLDKNAEQTQKDMQSIIVAVFDSNSQSRDSESFKAFNSAQIQYIKGQNFLVYGLTLQSSQKVRQESKDIIQHVAQNKDLHEGLLNQLLSILDQVLVLESSSSDQFFDLIQLLLGGLKDKIKAGDSETSNVYLYTFDQLFKHIDTELVKLLEQETQRKSLGADGYMPQISTGQVLSRIVSLVSLMIKESEELKKRIQNNVNIVIKAFLKVKKLNLTKNKVIHNSEVEIEKMFRELHSEKEEEKANFILTCIKVIESGDCDTQEMRFLFEEICKVIAPIKPEPDYLLQFTRPRSQEEYFGGRMSKNTYQSLQLGKSMGDIRAKICKETNTVEPELVELLVDNKLVNMDLSVRQVYEQVHWPAVYKQRNPDTYDVPSIEEAPQNQLTPMVVVYRLMGIDGEATENRVESLQDGSEGDMDPANILKKFGFTEILSRPFDSQTGECQTTGIHVLTQVLESFGPLVVQRYLAEWLFKLLGYALKIKANRVELLKQRKTVDTLAKRLFESVGMQSQVENQKSATLFDVILVLLEQVIVEVNQADESNSGITMEIDQQQENAEAAANLQIFIKILADSCADMVANGQGLEKTSKKIKAVSKILPFLINREDVQAMDILIHFISEALSKIPLLDNLAEMTAKEKFIALFNLERVIEILDSTPLSKNYIKDKIHSALGPHLLASMWTYLLSTTLADLSSEASVHKHKLANTYTLRVLLSYTKSHPLSQASCFASHRALFDKLYELTQTKYKERALTILGNDVVQSLTSKSQHNDADVQAYLQKLIDQQNDEKKRAAQKKREEIMRQMNAKKAANKFVQQLDSVAMQEELGPKCIVCQDGYTKKPTEVLGMYVYSKKLKIQEMSDGGSGFINTVGYTTVTHSNFIHLTCHQNAARADQQLKNPKNEWEGAIIRNEHSKCNNLFPLRGGNLRMDDYSNMAERYFQAQVKYVGNCDPDRVKVLQHDLKMILKRLAYEDSFSRDTHGGGPEHNMHFVPVMLQMSYQLLLNSHQKPAADGFIYAQEKRIAQFLEQGLKMKHEFLQKLEEEKKQGEIEEEVKMMDEGHSEGSQDEDDSSSQSLAQASKHHHHHHPATDENSGQMGDFSIDQIAFMLTQTLMFCQLPKWEQYKEDFLTIILCTVANIKGDALEAVKPMAGQTDFATGKKVLTIGKNDDVAMGEAVSQAPIEAIISGLGASGSTESRKRRLSSDNKSELIQKSLVRVRPLLVLMRLIDAFKHRWDSKRLALPSTGIKHDDYLKRLNEEILCQGNLREVMADCDDIFRDYKDHILKITSVEDFLADMGLLGKIVGQQSANTSQALEQYILKHF